MGNISLRKLFFIGFLGLIILPIIAVNIFLNKDYKESLTKGYSQQVGSVLNQIVIGIEDESKRLSLATSVIANDKDLTVDLENWYLEKNYAKRFTQSLEIDKKLNYLFTYSSDVNSLVIFFEDGSYYYYRRDLVAVYAVIRNREWYKKCLETQGKVVVIGYGESITNREDSLSTLALAISPKPITINHYIEAIYVDAISPTIEGLSKEQNVESSFFILDSALNTMVSSTTTESIDFSKYPNTFTTTDTTYVLNEQRYYVSYKLIDKLDWYVVYTQPSEIIQKNMSQILSVFYVAYSILVIFFGTYVFLFYRGSIVPLNALMKTMEIVQQGNLEVEASVTGPMEFRRLSLSFNDMMSRIKSLMQERDVKEKERSQEEIKALQAQINPHFIYNTLNTIKIMAMMSKANNIKKMLESFMKVIELNFKKKGSMMKITDELEYLESYIHIMKARYGSFFEVDYAIDEELLPTYIMQMILQPLVENAIIHGLNGKEDGRINIIMKVEEDCEGSNFLLSVIDNGIGIEADKIPELLIKPQGDVNHIGISNVKRRIEITYGPEYSLKITSKINEYTRIDIHLPRLYESEDAHV